MTNTDTRPILATINPEQLDALLEIIEHLPEGTAHAVMQSVIISAVREARDRAFEIEKLTKGAIEDVRMKTGAEPSPALVAIIVESVWENINTARHPHGEHGDGVLPGMEEATEPATNTNTTFTGEAARQLADAFNLTTEQEVTLAAEADKAAFLVDIDNAVSTVQPAGTAQRAVITDDGGSVESKTSTDGKIAYGADAAAKGRELLDQVAPDRYTDTSHLSYIDAGIPPYDTGGILPAREPADDGTTINDVSDKPLMSSLIEQAALRHRTPLPPISEEQPEPSGTGPVSAVSPQFGASKFTSDRTYPSTNVDSEPSTPE